MDIASTISNMFGVVRSAVTSEVQEPGPNDVGPTITTRAADLGPDGMPRLVTLQMSPDEVQRWWKEIERARAIRNKKAEKWDLLLNEYLPVIHKSGEKETVKVMQHFRNVHAKLGQLFYRAPDLTLEPRDPSVLSAQIPNPMGPQAPPLTAQDIVLVKQEVLRMKLGRDGIKVTRLMDELLFDALAWAGFGACKVGYRATFQPVPQTPPEPAPGAVLGLSAPPQALPVPIFEEWYARRFSPKKALWDPNLSSGRFDEDATWTGMEFFLSKRQAMRLLGLTEDEAAKAEHDTLKAKYEGESQAEGPALVRCVEIALRSEHYVDGALHPKQMHQLIIVEGLRDRPVVYRPHPDQSFDERGRLTQDSLEDFPFRFLTLRDMADTPYTIADSGFTNAEIKQLTTLLRQGIALRDAAIGKYLYDPDKMTPEAKDLLETGDPGVYIPVESEALANGVDKIIGLTPQATRTQDDYRLTQAIQSYIDQTLGINATGAGAEVDTVRSATEISGMLSAMQGRNDKELHRVLEFYLQLARMVDTLLMRYADAEDYVTITGMDGQKRIQMWNNVLIAGKYLYDFSPDSAVKIDTERDFDLLMKYWNLAAKSPLTNQEYVLKRMARMRGMDPDKAVKPAASLEGPKEPPIRLSMALKGEDLRNPAVVKILVDAGVLRAEDVSLNHPPPPEGAADKADTVSKHTMGTSGQTPNGPGTSDYRASLPEG